MSTGRVLTTLLFADIVGSTELAARLGDRRWRELLDRYQDVVRGELERFHGREIDNTGDGFLAAFDVPERAIRGAQAIRDGARRLGIEVRVGVHAGEVETAGAAVRGIAVHMGARVAAEAGSGEILVSSTVRDLVAGSDIEFEDRGLRTLKGVPEERRLFAVSGPATAGTPSSETGTGVASGLRIRLLGGFRVSIASHEISSDRWRLRKPRSLVKMLALVPGHRLHREQVMELLWPDSVAASNNLRKALHVARRTLASADAGQAARYLHLQHDLIALAPDGDVWVDVEAFEGAAAAARDRRDAESYRGALDVYAGDLLPEDRYEDWSSGRREALRLTHLALLTDLAALYEREGQYARGIETLQRLLIHDPTCEDAHVGLMRMYATTGQRPLALRQYQVLKELIKREFDSDPDLAVQTLHEDIQSGRFPPDAMRSGSLRAQAEAPSERRTNLPLQLTSFVGRTREIAEIRERIAAARHVTLTGPGGVGKTRLALEVARHAFEEFPDGVWLIDLSPLTDPARVPQAMASVLGVGDEPGRPLIEALADYLSAKKTLLLLDNCEHLTAACAELAETLLRRCPHIRALATSRESLGIAGELVYQVPSLSLPDLSGHPTLDELIEAEALRLFAARAALADQGFALTQVNAPTIAQICARVDGIPLAIELAAARVKTLSVEGIASRLDDRFRLLTGGIRTAIPRHRTLRAATDWSYNLLPDFERALLRRLSVFAGGFTLEAAEAVCAGDDLGEGDVLDLLARLVDKSLVVVDRSAKTRYRQLKTINQYARERLVEEGEVDRVMRRYRDFFLALAEQAEPEFRGPHQMTWLNHLEAEHDNFRAALEWSLEQDDSDVGLRLAAALAGYWHARAFLTEGREWLARALARGREASELRMRALVGAGRLAFAQDDFERAGPLLEEAVPFARVSGDQRALALALAWLGHSLWHMRDRASGAATCEESVALSRTLGDPWVTAVALTEAGIVASHEGDMQRAREFVEESLGLFRTTGDVGGLALCLSLLGSLAASQGDHQRAAELIEEALALQSVLGRASAEGASLGRLSRIALLQGEYDRAGTSSEHAMAIADRLGVKADSATRRVIGGLAALAVGDLDRAGTLFDEALAIRQQIEWQDGIAESLAALGVLARYRSNHARARQLLEESRAVLREARGTDEIAVQPFNIGNLVLFYNLGNLGLRFNLGLIALAEGDAEQAATLLRESVTQSKERSNPSAIMHGLEGLARVAVSLGRFERAARLLGAAEVLRETIAAPRWPVDEQAYAREVADARAALGEEGFAAAWTAGRVMTRDEAMQFALDNDVRDVTSESR